MWITDLRDTAKVEIRRGWLALLPSLAIVLVLIAVSAPATTVAAPQSLREIATSADQAYRDGNYDEAVELYRQVLTAGYESGPLFYNLGNAYYKSGQLGESILMYERALRLMPHSGDVRYNLELARDRAVDRIQPPPRLFVWDILDTVRDLFPPAILSWSSWVLAMLFAIAVVFAMNLHRYRRAFTSISSVFGVLLVLNLALLGLRASTEFDDPAAIIMQREIAVRSAPDATSSEVFELHEGTRVTIVQHAGGWSEVRLADGRQGWMPDNAYTLI